MYGAAAALLIGVAAEPDLALAFGLIAAAALRPSSPISRPGCATSISPSDADLFADFLRLIFTWTEVTGGENGLKFRRPELAFRACGHAVHGPRRCTGSCSPWWRVSY